MHGEQESCREGGLSGHEVSQKDDDQTGREPMEQYIHRVEAGGIAIPERPLQAVDQGGHRTPEAEFPAVAVRPVGIPDGGGEPLQVLDVLVSSDDMVVVVGEAVGYAVCVRQHSHYGRQKGRAISCSGPCQRFHCPCL